MIKLPVFYVTLPEFILGRTKFTQQYESTMIFKFYI
jgi:hypothetical protein